MIARNRIRGLLLALAAASVPAQAQALGKTSLDLEIDAYYSALGLTVPFVGQADEKDVEKEELKTYRDMLSRALIPRYLVLEASVNPLPLAGVLIRRHGTRFYEEAQFSPSANLVDAITAGFEEPYALAVFLGKVIDFAPGKKSLGRARKGYVGYLASFGQYHILNSQLVPDHWVELEAKVKGDQATDKRKMSWSFRAGAKLHGHQDILDTFYVGLRRSRTDFEKVKHSFWLSTALEYRVDFNRHDLDPVSHYVMLEKNIPWRKKKWTFSVGVGYLFLAREKYAGELARRRTTPESQFLLRPNLKF